VNVRTWRHYDCGAAAEQESCRSGLMIEEGSFSKLKFWPMDLEGAGATQQDKQGSRFCRETPLSFDGSAPLGARERVLYYRLLCTFGGSPIWRGKEG
jgi:hypothetical protein